MDSNNEKNLEHDRETSKFLESWTKQIDFFFSIFQNYDRHKKRLPRF